MASGKGLQRPEGWGKKLELCSEKFSKKARKKKKKVWKKCLGKKEKRLSYRGNPWGFERRTRKKSSGKE